MMVTRLQSTNQKAWGMLGVMSALLFGCRDIHGRILAREPGGPRKGAAIRLPLERESMALDRSKRPPRERARQAIFLGETEPRAARPLGASPRVRQLRAAGWGCQRKRRPRLFGRAWARGASA